MLENLQKGARCQCTVSHCSGRYDCSGSLRVRQIIIQISQTHREQVKKPEAFANLYDISFFSNSCLYKFLQSKYATSEVKINLVDIGAVRGATLIKAGSQDS